jgi:hypothetical protein
MKEVQLIKSLVVDHITQMEQFLIQIIMLDRQINFNPNNLQLASRTAMTHHKLHQELCLMLHIIKPHIL